jgi:hypothetical protein
MSNISGMLAVSREYNGDDRDDGDVVCGAAPVVVAVVDILSLSFEL